MAKSKSRASIRNGLAEQGGRRFKIFMRKELALCDKFKLAPDRVMALFDEIGTPGKDLDGWLARAKPHADALAIDWQGLIDFMNALVPIIQAMMASSGAAQAKAFAAA